MKHYYIGIDPDHLDSPGSDSKEVHLSWVHLEAIIKGVARVSPTEKTVGVHVDENGITFNVVPRTDGGIPERK